MAAPTWHTASAASALQVNVYAFLAGTWLGPGLGDTGRCGAEYGQFTFFRNGTYAYTSNTYNETNDDGVGCGGITNAGYFRVGRGVITLHWIRCNYPCAAGMASARFAFLGANAFALTDQGGEYVYYRQ
jgi:hypothetical protein